MSHLGGNSFVDMFNLLGNDRMTADEITVDDDEEEKSPQDVEVKIITNAHFEESISIIISSLTF